MSYMRMFSQSGAGGTINGITGNVTLAASSPMNVAVAGQTITFSGPFTCFVFKPGGVATAPGGNVYTNFNTLYTDFNKVRGNRQIMFDASAGSCSIPTGSFDFTGARFVGADGLTTVGVDDGSTWTGQFPYIDGIGLISTSNSVVFTFTTGNSAIYFDNIASLQANGSAPVIRLDNTSGGITFSAVLLKTGASLESGVTPCIDYKSVVNGFIYAEEAATVPTNSISGNVASLVIGIIPVGSGQISTTQPSFLGTLAIDLTDFAINHVYDDTSTNLGSSTVQGAIAALAQRVAPFNVNVTPVSNSSTTETDLMSANMSSVPMNAAGDTYLVFASGTFAVSASTKTLKLYYGSTAAITSGAIAISGGSWTIEGYISRVSNGHQIASFKVTVTSAALVTTTVVNVSDPAGGNGDIIKVTGTDSLASSGITQKYLYVRDTLTI